MSGHELVFIDLLDSMQGINFFKYHHDAALTHDDTKYQEAVELIQVKINQLDVPVI